MLRAAYWRPLDDGPSFVNSTPIATPVSRYSTVPTLNAAAGDLSLVLPKRILDGIIEMIYALDKVAPGTANDDTLLYGVEVKFYSSKVLVGNNFETEIKGLYAIGDGAGITRGLMQASVTGMAVADDIVSQN